MKRKICTISAVVGVTCAPAFACAQDASSSGYSSTDLLANRKTEVGRTAQTGIGEVGQRQEESEAARSLTPMTRLDSRIENRVENRIRNRVDEGFISRTDARFSFSVALEETRQRKPKRPK